MFIISDIIDPAGQKSSHPRDWIISEGLRPPDMTTLVITNGCNLNCRHCWPDSKPATRVVPAPTDALMRLILEFAQLETTTLCLTGGEPLTHPDWHELVQYACSLSQFEQVRLQTNATLITDTELKKFDAINPKRLTIQVSIEGAIEKVHDAIRGKGSFSKTVQGLKALAQAGFGDRIEMAFTETYDNFEQLPLILALAEMLKIPKVVSGMLVVGGRAARDATLAPPEPCQYENLLGLYHHDRIFRERYKKMANISAIEWFQARNESSDGICDLIEKPYITADGTMYPCLMFQADEYAVKNLHERTLKEAIEEMIPIWAKLRLMSHQRGDTMEKCQTCRGKNHCRGGCMGRAFAANRDFMTTEDRCGLRRAVYEWKGKKR